MPDRINRHRWQLQRYGEGPQSQSLFHEWRQKALATREAYASDWRDFAAWCLSRGADGLRILIRRSKGDQEGHGQEVAIPRGYRRLRPVEAVQAWLAAAGISSGPVFRAVAQGGKVSDAPLAEDSAARIVKRYAQRVGLDPASYAGHSLRSGFLTSAAESGASVWKLSEVSRHKSLDTLRGYIRNADLPSDLHAKLSVPV